MLGSFSSKTTADEAAYTYVEQTILPAISNARRANIAARESGAARKPKNDTAESAEHKILSMQYQPDVKVTQPGAGLSLRIELTWEENSIVITVIRNQLSDAVWDRPHQPIPPIGNNLPATSTARMNGGLGATTNNGSDAFGRISTPVNTSLGGDLLGSKPIFGGGGDCFSGQRTASSPAPPSIRGFSFGGTSASGDTGVGTTVSNTPRSIFGTASGDDGVGTTVSNTPRSIFGNANTGITKSGSLFG